MNKTTIKFLASLVGWAAFAAFLTGCAGGIFGTGVGDGKVSDGAILDLGR
jgi:hypothetical protein